MRRPGERARSFFARWCTDKMMRQRIDPAIADMQSEYGQARRDARVWKSRWVRLSAYVALAKLAVCCAGERVGRAVVEWPAGELRRVSRVAVACGVATTGAMLLMLWTQAAEYEVLLADSGYSTVLFLVPSVLSMAITLGLVLGIAWSGEEASRRLRSAIIVMALAASVAVVVNLGWMTPTANQAFRSSVFRAAGGVGELPKGVNELTFPEMDSGVAYHRRLQFAAAPIVLALFALSLRGRGRIRRVGEALAGLAIWYVALGATGLWANLAPEVTVAVLWLPNLAFVLLAVGRWRNERALTRRASP